MSDTGPTGPTPQRNNVRSRSRAPRTPRPCTPLRRAAPVLAVSIPTIDHQAVVSGNEGSINDDYSQNDDSIVTTATAETVESDWDELVISEQGAPEFAFGQTREQIEQKVHWMTVSTKVYGKDKDRYAASAIGKHVTSHIQGTILSRLISEHRDQLVLLPMRDEEVLAVLWWIRCVGNTSKIASRKKRKGLGLSVRKQAGILLMNLMYVVWKDKSDKAFDALADYMDTAFFMVEPAIATSYFNHLATKLGVPLIERAGMRYQEHKLLVCASILTNLCGGNARAAKRMVGKRHYKRMLQDYNDNKSGSLSLIPDPEIESLIARCTQLTSFAKLSFDGVHRPLRAQEWWFPASASNHADDIKADEADDADDTLAPGDTHNASPSDGSNAPAVDTIKAVMQALDKVIGSHSMEVHAEAARAVDAVCPELQLESKMRARVGAEYNAVFSGLFKQPTEDGVSQKASKQVSADDQVWESPQQVSADDQVWESLDMAFIVRHSEGMYKALLAVAKNREDEFSKGFMKPLWEALHGPKKEPADPFEECCAGRHWTPSDVVVTEILGNGAFGVVTKATLKNGNEFALKAEVCDLESDDVLYVVRSIASQATTHGSPYVVRLLGFMSIPISSRKDRNDVEVQRFILCTFHELCASDLEKERIPLKQDFDKTKDLSGIIRVMEDCSCGLEQLAKHEVSHRDIKPENIAIAQDGMCKIMDFGLAKGGGNASDAGTEVYKPPTVYSSTLRGDRFSMALVFYEIITGALPKRRLVEHIGNVVDLASFEALDDAVKGARGGPDVAELIKEMLDMDNSCTSADVKNRVQKIRKQVQGGEAGARK